MSLPRDERAHLAAALRAVEEECHVRTFLDVGGRELTLCADVAFAAGRVLAGFPSSDGAGLVAEIMDAIGSCALDRSAAERFRRRAEAL